MNRIRVCLATICLAAIVPTASTLALTPAPPVIHYQLQDRSDFEYGCFGLCDCPNVALPMKGAFDLEYSGFDGLYDNYRVSNVRWTSRRGDTDIDIAGSGKYRIGGEVALLQQLSLDLSIDSADPLHFDSGLVSGASGFPKIDVMISLHGMAECLDTVMHVVAAPIPADVDDQSASGLERVVPNPFVDHVQVDVVTRMSGRIEARVYDALGRQVRVLADRAWLAAGRHRLEWDGRNAAGAACEAGIYFVEVRAEGKDHLRRVVKLR